MAVRPKEHKGVDTFLGQGALRFLLTYDQEMPDSSFGQFVVTVDDYKNIDSLIATSSAYFKNKFPNAEVRLKKFVRGPAAEADIEVRFMGDDPAVLRRLSQNAQTVMDRDPQAININDDNVDYQYVDDILQGMIKKGGDVDASRQFQGLETASSPFWLFREKCFFHD